MLNNKDSIISKLKRLGLSEEEARIYQELLEGPNTHLKLARATGINRTKIYRIVDQLEKRSLVSVRSDDRGTFLVASDPSTLEIELVTQEESLKSRRQAFVDLLPLLESTQNNDVNSFVVHTYEGEEGFKQMLWHELKTNDELVALGAATPYDLVSGSDRWVQKYRLRMAERGYNFRIICNSLSGKLPKIENKRRKTYEERTIPAKILPLEIQITIYNDTVAVYRWRDQAKKTGVEIVNKQLTSTMRAVFELYWNKAK